MESVDTQENKRTIELTNRERQMLLHLLHGLVEEPWASIRIKLEKGEDTI